MLEQQRKRAEAEVVLQKRREAMEALDAWSFEFLGTAKLVFNGDKAQLKKLGLPVVVGRGKVAEVKPSEGSGDAVGDVAAGEDNGGAGSEAAASGGDVSNEASAA